MSTRLRPEVSRGSSHATETVSSFPLQQGGKMPESALESKKGHCREEPEAASCRTATQKQTLSPREQAGGEKLQKAGRLWTNGGGTNGSKKRCSKSRNSDGGSSREDRNWPGKEGGEAKTSSAAATTEASTSHERRLKPAVHQLHHAIGLRMVSCGVVVTWLMPEDVNCAPLSDVNVVGTPKLKIKVVRAATQFSAELFRTG